MNFKVTYSNTGPYDVVVHEVNIMIDRPDANATGPLSPDPTVELFDGSLTVRAGAPHTFEKRELIGCHGAFPVMITILGRGANETIDSELKATGVIDFESGTN